MITKFVERFDAKREELRAGFLASAPSDYMEIVKAVVVMIRDSDEYESPDPSRITMIDHGDYQGTLLFVIAAEGYQPSTYWAVKVGYGSCSGCDTLQAVSEENDPAERARQTLELALHVVQQITLIGGELA